jgi:hypothetical protein
MMIGLSRATDIQTADDKANNHIKTFIAVALVIALLLGYAWNATNDPKDPDAPLEFLCGAVGVMVGYYWRTDKK